MERRDNKLLWDISRWAIITLIGLGAAYAKVQDIPAIKAKLDSTESRVTALEVSMKNIEKGIDKMDGKIDKLINRSW